MKKELVTSLLVAVSMGVGVLGTNIYYDNVNSQPKTQIEQDQDKKEIKDAAKENKKEKEEKEVKEETTTNKDKNSDKESKQVIKNTETKETAKTNTNNSQSKTEVKETNKSDSNNKTQQPTKSNGNIIRCNECGKLMDGEGRYGLCNSCWIKACMPEETPDDYDEPVGDYWQIDPNNPNRVTNTDPGSGNSSGSGDSFRSTLRIQDFVE